MAPTTRRKFIKIETPLFQMDVPVLGTPEELAGKTVKLDMSRKMRGKGMEAILKIENNEGKLIAHPKSLTLTKAYIRRMMRKRIDYVEDSFDAKCSDIQAKIKPFLITRKRVSRAVRRNLRNTTREFILNYVKEKTYLQVCEDLIQGTLQKEIIPKLKKVYPLSFCDIRVIETKQLTEADKTYSSIHAEEEKTQAEEIEEELAKKKAEEEESEKDKEDDKSKKKVAKKTSKKKSKKSVKKEE